jgi:hypothetical protein
MPPPSTSATKTTMPRCREQIRYKQHALFYPTEPDGKCSAK